MILNFHDCQDRVLNVMKSRQDNNVIDLIGLVYVETKTELSGPIWLSVVYEKNHIEQ